MKFLESIQHRALEIRAATRADDRTLEVAFASSEPVERYFGMEILDMSGVDLTRLLRGAPLLLQHDQERQIGVVVSARVDDDGVARAQVRFSKAAHADEIYQDVLDGIRTQVSVGYQIRAAKLMPDEESYLITDWLPLEISIVSIPADATVGVGRAAPEPVSPVVEETVDTIIPAPVNKEIYIMTPDEIRAAEIARARDILALGQRFNQPELARQFVENGQAVDAFREAVLEKMGAKPALETPEIGLSEKEVRDYSIVRAIRAMSTGNFAEAGFELEVSEAVAKKMHKTRSTQGFYVPMDVTVRGMTKGVQADGGYLVDTQLDAASFIEMLRNAMQVRALGARVLGGLVGDIAIPRQTGGATAYWVGENGAPSGSQPVLDQVGMSPKTVGAYTDMSRRLLLQSSLDVESMVRADLAATLAAAIDQAAINGSAANGQPVGILNATGVNLVSIGANGGSLGFGHVVDMETAVAVANAMGSMAYLTNAKVRGFGKKTAAFANTGRTIWEGSSMNGYTAAVSNAMPSNLSKGTGVNLSAMIFGNFADLLIGEWGALDIQVDPYTSGASGAVRVRVLQDVDVAIRHPQSFSICTDIQA